jgi:hypothetical protein
VTEMTAQRDGHCDASCIDPATDEYVTCGRRLAHQGAHESFWPDGVVYARWYSTCASSAGMRTHTPSAASPSDQREVARAHQ